LKNQVKYAMKCTKLFGENYNNGDSLSKITIQDKP